MEVDNQASFLIMRLRWRMMVAEIFFWWCFCDGLEKWRLHLSAVLALSHRAFVVVVDSIALEAI